MINELIDFMVDEGLEVPSRYDTYESIADAVANDKIKAIIRNGTPIGFFTWREYFKNEKQYVYIENMCVKRKFRNKNNLLCLRKFFRNLYPNCQFAYWDSQKKGTWVYSKPLI